MAEQLTHHPVYNTLDRDDFNSMLEADRYGERSSDFDETCEGDDLMFCVCDAWDGSTCPAGFGSWTRQDILCTCAEWMAGSCAVEGR